MLIKKLVKLIILNNLYFFNLLFFSLLIATSNLSANPLQGNLAPDCSNTSPSESVLWPPNHKFSTINILGVSDPDGDTITTEVQCIKQDESLNSTGDGNTEYDGSGVGTPLASVRRERKGNSNGRVYHISYIATDSNGARCGGAIQVSVPKSKKKTAVDEGSHYDSVDNNKSNCDTSNINNPPSVFDQSISLDEDTSAEITLTASDPDQDQMTFTVADGPTHGTITGNAPNFVYVPYENFHGEDSFTYKANDGQVDSAIATVSISVLPVNDAPVVVDQTLEVNEDSSLSIILVGSDIESNALTLGVLQGPLHGTLTGTSPNLTYVPNSNFNGEDSFTFKANDGQVDSEIATVFITVLPVNDTPVAQNLSFEINEDNSLLITFTASDVDGDNLSFTLIDQPNSGALSGTVPNLVYTPNANFNGNDSFAFKVNDGQVDSAIATVSITVLPVNDAPIVESQALEVNEDSSLAIIFSGSDLESNGLIFSVLEAPSNGSLVGVTPNLTYVPNPDFNGTDSFIFKANDGQLDSAIAKVSIIVLPVNDTPLTQNQSLEVNEDEPVAITLLGSDADGDNLIYSIKNQPSSGTLSGTVPDITYKPNTNFHGTDSFTYVVNDGTLDSQQATISITVISVNDLPSVDAGADQMITEGNSVTLLAISSDVDGEIVSQEWKEDAVVLGDTPELVLPELTVGEHHFVVTVVDNEGATASDNVTVVVEEKPNVAPIADAQSINTTEGLEANITLAASDKDNDGLTYSVVTPPANGTISGEAPSIVYLPKTGFYGEDSFTFKSNDGTVDSNIATVSITVERLPDTTPPVITLNGGDVTIAKGSTYVDAGASAIDDRDGDIPVTVTGNVDTAIKGSYTLVYSAVDIAGNNANKTRVVTVFQNFPPVVFSLSQNETQVTTQSAYLADDISITALSDGGYIITWVSFGDIESSDEPITRPEDTETLPNGPIIPLDPTDGPNIPSEPLDDPVNLPSQSDTSVIMQRYDSYGNKVGFESKIITNHDGEDIFPSIAAFDNGEYIVTWNSLSQGVKGIFSQRFDSRGEKKGDEVKVDIDTGFEPGFPSVTTLKDGGYIVIWNTSIDDGNDESRVYKQRFDLTGNKVGIVTQVNTTKTIAIGNSKVLSLTDGGFIISWLSIGPDGLYFQRFDKDGKKVGIEVEVNNLGFEQSFYYGFSILSDGNFIFSWTVSEDEGASGALYLQKFDSEAEKVGSTIEFKNFPVLSNLAPLEDGGYVITWSDYNYWLNPEQIEINQSTGLYLQRFDVNGNIVGPERLVNGSSNKLRLIPFISTLRDGGIVITWATREPDFSSEIYLQQFDGSENKMYPGLINFQINPAEIISGNLNHIIDPDGDFLTYSAESALHGVFEIDTSGNWSYEADNDFLGTETIEIVITDGRGGELSYKLLFHIKPVDITAPVITLYGANPINIAHGDFYLDAGATAIDDQDGPVPVVITGEVNTFKLGTYPITYSATDLKGNIATATRTVIVEDLIPPSIFITGNNPANVSVGSSYVDEGATAKDNADGVINVTVISNNVDTSTVGAYTVEYSAADTAGNTSTAIRNVNVIQVADVVAPVITILGNNPSEAIIGTAYEDEGATANDNVDGLITVTTISNNVDTSKEGTYSVRYTATDAAGNTAQALRTVNVVSNPNVATFEINIIDPEGNSLSGAKIQVFKDSLLQKEIINTSSNFTAINLPGETGYIIRVEKAGYAPSVIANRTPANSFILILDAILVPHDVSKIVTSTSTQDVISEQGAKVSFGANNFVDSQGNIVDEFEASITPIDITKRALLPAFPGQFLGTTSTDGVETKPLVSYGVVDFSFKKNNSPIQLLAGLEATIEIPLFVSRELNGIDLQIGNVLPVWSLNETNGIWQYETDGIIVASGLSPTGMAVSAQVNHFTFFSTGAFEREGDFVNVTVRILDSKNTSNLGEGGGYRLIKTTAQSNIPAYNDKVNNIQSNGLKARNFITVNKIDDGNSIDDSGIGPETKTTTRRWIKTGPYCAILYTTYSTGEVVVGTETCIEPPSDAENSAMELNPDPIIKDPEIDVIDTVPSDFVWKKNFSGNISSIVYGGSSHIIIAGNELRKLNPEGESVWSIPNISQTNFSPELVRKLGNTIVLDSYEKLSSYGGTGEELSSFSLKKSGFTAIDSDMNNSFGPVMLRTDSNNNLYLAQYNFEGDLVWEIDSPVSNTSLLFSGVAQSSNEVYVGAESDGGLSVSMRDIETGVEVIDNYFNKPKTLDVFTIVNNSLMIGGAFSNSPENKNTYLRLMAVGRLVVQYWEKEYTLENISAVATGNGGYYLTGQHEGLIHVTKIDSSSGDVLWSKSFGSGTPTSIYVFGDTIYVGGQGFLMKIGKQIADKPDQDTVAPVIKLIGEKIVSIVVGGQFIDSGATALDKIDGTLDVVVDSNLDTSVVGRYEIKYTTTDKSGNNSTIIRTVFVTATENQSPKAAGGPDKIIKYGEEIILDAGGSIDFEGPIEKFLWEKDNKVVSVDKLLNLGILPIGVYEVILTVTDQFGAKSTDNVLIRVDPANESDLTPPVISILGENPVTLVLGATYTDAGATSVDDVDGDVIVTIVSNTVDTSTPGTYSVAYSAVDASGNEATAIRTVNVGIQAEDTIPPTISILGDNPTSISQGVSYFDAGATATDETDGVVKVIIVENTVDNDTQGSYIVTYSAVDTAGNEATASRIINVIQNVDTVPPQITILGDNPVTISQGITYTDAGATAIDDIDSSVDVVTSGVVDSNTPGSYTITYTATDTAGNSSVTTRSVVVTPADSSIVVLSPVFGSTIKYNFVTLKIKDTVTNLTAKNLSIPNVTEYIGIKNLGSYLVYNVFLQQGKNEIEIVARDTNGNSVKSILTINSEGKGIPPVYLKLDREKGYASLTTQAQIIHSSLNISTYFIDIDGDKVIDIESGTDTQMLEFPAIGAYHTMVTVKTTDNIFYSSLNRYNTTVNVINNPELQSTDIPNINAEVHDLEEQGNFVFALMNSRIVKISKDDETQTEVITLSGFSNPQGFILDGVGNIYIADTGSDRVVKLLASNNYQEDLSFVINIGGSENGQLMSPMDVTVMDTGEDLKVFVLDTGNNRIQVFDHEGTYLDQFDGSTTPQGKLSNPLNMIGAPRITLVDSGNNIVREILYNSRTKTETGVQLLALANAGKVSDLPGGLLVPDKSSKELLYLNNTGEIVDKLPLTQTIQIAMSYEKNHQLLYAGAGSSYLKHVYIPKTAQSAAPTALSQKFVQAYLANDEQTMLEFAPKSLLDELGNIGSRVTEAFNNITFYNESIYFHGNNAAVNGKARLTEGEVIIKFYYVWKNGRWLLQRVM